MVRLSSEISTSVKLLKVSWALKLELHTTLHQKSGKTNLMIWRVTYGLLAACYSKCVRLSHHSTRKTCRAFIRKCVRVRFPPYPSALALILIIFCASCFNRNLCWGQPVLKFLTNSNLLKTYRAVFQLKWIHQSNWLARFVSLLTSNRFKTDYPPVTTREN